MTTTVRGTGELVDAGLGLLDRERIIAKAGFNRWLVPPGRALHSSVHRHGVRLQRLLAAPIARAWRYRSQGVSRHFAGAGTFHDQLRLAHR